MATFISNSAAETEAFGREMGGGAERGAVFALKGELGAGKTQFVKGVAAGIGSSDAVTSPTFTLVHEYRGGRLPIYHFDLFRVDDVPEAEKLGMDDYFFGDGISIVEWADKFPELIPTDAKWFSFATISENRREITT